MPKVRDLCLVSNNCEVWACYKHLPHLLGEVYQTPWIGMHIPNDAQFLKLCLHYQEYAWMEPRYGEATLEQMVTAYGTPVMFLGDIEIHWIHEAAVEDVDAKFRRRRERSRDKRPFFFWSDIQTYQMHPDEERERMTADFLSIPERQRLYVSRDDVPEWRDAPFDLRVKQGHAEHLQWNQDVLGRTVRAYLERYDERYGE